MQQKNDGKQKHTHVQKDRQGEKAFVLRLNLKHERSCVLNQQVTLLCKQVYKHSEVFLQKQEPMTSRAAMLSKMKSGEWKWINLEFLQVNWKLVMTTSAKMLVYLVI